MHLRSSAVSFTYRLFAGSRSKTRGTADERGLNERTEKIIGCMIGRINSTLQEGFMLCRRRFIRTHHNRRIYSVGANLFAQIWFLNRPDYLRVSVVEMSFSNSCEPFNPCSSKDLGIPQADVNG